MTELGGKRARNDGSTLPIARRGWAPAGPSIAATDRWHAQARR
jgi:hypothetical protein